MRVNIIESLYTTVYVFSLLKNEYIDLSIVFLYRISVR